MMDAGTSGGSDLYHEEVGEGEPILLIHPSGSTGSTWGPVVEELYFRGHLLPRIDRFGRGAPVLNAVLFSVYHLWTPWQNIGRILGLVPWIYTVWRKRSVALSMAVHISVNCIFLLLVLAALTAD